MYLLVCMDSWFSGGKPTKVPVVRLSGYQYTTSIKGRSYACLADPPRVNKLNEDITVPAALRAPRSCLLDVCIQRIDR